MVSESSCCKTVRMALEGFRVQDLSPVEKSIKGILTRFFRRFRILAFWAQALTVSGSYESRMVQD